MNLTELRSYVDEIESTPLDALMAHTSPPVRAALDKDIAPIDDIRSTLEYRARVTANLLEEFRSQL